MLFTTEYVVRVGNYFPAGSYEIQSHDDSINWLQTVVRIQFRIITVQQTSPGGDFRVKVMTPARSIASNVTCSVGHWGCGSRPGTPPVPGYSTKNVSGCSHWSVEAIRDATGTWDGVTSVFPMGMWRMTLIMSGGGLDPPNGVSWRLRG